MIDRVPEELSAEVYDIIQEAEIKTISKKKKCKKVKWLSEEVLQIAEKRREAKGKGEKQRYTHLNAEFQRITMRGKKAFRTDQCKQIDKNNRIISVQSLSHVRLFATTWTATHQASLSITIFRSLLKLISIESVMPSNQLDRKSVV